LIGNTECDIQKITGNEIQFTVKGASAGNYSILIKTSQGNSNNNLIFKYNLQLISQSNTQGINIRITKSL
jgi:hypothetical protein